MAEFGSAQLISEMDRQLRVLKTDLIPRTLALATLFTLVGLRIGIVIPLACALCYFLSEWSTVGLSRQFRAHPTRARYLGLMLGTVLGGCAVALSMVALWEQGQDFERYIALVGLTGAMLHVVLLRTPHLPMGLFAAAPILLGITALVFGYYFETGDTVIFLLSLFGAAVLEIYFISGLVSFHKMQAQLIAARTKALEASASKSRFLATMSHELRTPLNAILGVSQLLQSDIDHPETPRRIAALDRSARSLLGIVDDVLDMRSVEQGRLDIRPVATELVGEVEAIVELHGPLAANEGLDLRLEVDEEVPETAIFDPLRVRQCLTNLLNNALKYTSEGEVVVRVAKRLSEKGDPLISVEVHDSGTGLPDVIRHNLFDAGHRGTAERSADSGAGLGLTISKSIAAAMGGDVVLKHSSAEGTCFEFTFEMEPVEQSLTVGGASVARVPLHAQGQGVKVLVVDDIETNCMITSAFLTAEGYEVETAADGYAALDAASNQAFDIVLLDMNMPKLDGLTTFRMLRERQPDLPIVALTADALPEDRARYLGHGLDGYIAKPLDRNVLLQEVRERLNGARTVSPPKAVNYS